MYRQVAPQTLILVIAENDGPAHVQIGCVHVVSFERDSCT